MKNNNFFYSPRNFKDIKIWENVSETEWNDPIWQDKNSIKDVEHLNKVIKLNNYQKSEIKRVISQMKSEGKEPMRITPYYASIMQYDVFNPKMYPGEKEEIRLDPIFLQSVPTPAHLLFPNTGVEDAMDEENRSYGAAYQRYPNRVALFVAENTSCASFCTHCQRTKSLDAKTQIKLEKINKGLFYISSNRNIDEVLVTGGDALRIGKKRLAYVLEELGRIPHIRSIRIATRVPVVMPMGVTEELLDTIAQSVNKYNDGIDKYVYFMIHVNHHHEITEDFAKAIKRIRSHGYSVLNQTVLLKHVNAYFKTLCETFRRMAWSGVEPYYLLQCHKERGLVHFITPIQIGKIYIKHFQGWLSGTYKPSFAANIEGGGGKVLLMPSGHDTINVGADIEDNIYDGSANVTTWDARKIENYEALGRASREEFDKALEIMEKFIGKKNSFYPCINIINENGEYVETTFRGFMPHLSNERKSDFLEYEKHINNMPITNPSEIAEDLDKKFVNSKFKSVFKKE